MNFQKFLIPLFAISTIFFQSCPSGTEAEPIEFGYDYFPLEIGKYIEYDVDSIIYDIGAGNNVMVRENSIQIREEVADSFSDNEGRIVYRIERFERNDEAEEWRVKDVWSTTVTDRQAERIEENLRFIKMIFPVSENTDPWDGNKYIDDNLVISVAGESISIFKNWLYQYNQINIPLEVNGLNFDDVVEIYQAADSNFIELRLSYEQYARGVGLIKREMKILDTQCIIDDCVWKPWEEKAEKGFILRQTIRDYN